MKTMEYKKILLFIGPTQFYFLCREALFNPLQTSTSDYYNIFLLSTYDKTLKNK